MMNNSKIGVALVGGYVLGRTKKAKLAIGLGMFLAGKKLNFDPKQLGSMLTDSKLLGGLNEQIRKELVDTTKSAATSALTNRIGGISDSLHKRTLQLDGGGEESEADEDDDDRDYEDEDDRDRDDRDDDGAEAGESDTEEKPKAARAARKPPPSSSKTASSTRTRVSEETGKAASGGRKTASSARKATSGARKSTSGARKTASGAKKTASGTTRKASNRGGGNA